MLQKQVQGWRGTHRQPVSHDASMRHRWLDMVMERRCCKLTKAKGASGSSTHGLAWLACCGLALAMPLATRGLSDGGMELRCGLKDGECEAARVKPRRD